MYRVCFKSSTEQMLWTQHFYFYATPSCKVLQISKSVLFYITCQTVIGGCLQIFLKLNRGSKFYKNPFTDSRDGTDAETTFFCICWQPRNYTKRNGFNFGSSSPPYNFYLHCYRPNSTLSGTASSLALHKVADDEQYSHREGFIFGCNSEVHARSTVHCVP
jgi:hypothetical protein